MRKMLFFLLIGWLNLNANANNRIYYVSPEGNNTDGTTWQNAFNSLLDAQRQVEAPCQIWVKQATYEIIDTTLTILNGVNVYGGFKGVETQLSQRDSNPALTVLNGNKARRILAASTDLTTETIWDGFTIQNGKSASGGGVLLLQNSTLINCIVQNNRNYQNNGGGVHMASNNVDSVKLINCIIKNNVVYFSGVSSNTPYGGGGVFMHISAKSGLIKDCIIENNYVNGDAYSNAKLYGGGVFVQNGTVLNTTIKNNRATSLDPETNEISTVGDVCAGGMMVMTHASDNILIKKCLIAGNKAPVKIAGGMYIDPLWTSVAVRGKVMVEDCIITDNYSRNQGGGVFTSSNHSSSTAEYVFSNCVIANNEVEYNPGGGVFINNQPPSAVRFMNTTIVNNQMNTYNYGGAGVFYNHIQTDMTNCIFWGNLNAGTNPLKHHLRTKVDLSSNNILYCAFDPKYKEQEISLASNPAALDGLVSVELENTGLAGGSYVKFVRPTSFIGIAKNAEQKQEIENANWALAEGSACIDVGATIRSLRYDLSGNARPYGDAYDIGAYEYSGTTSIRQNQYESLQAYGDKNKIIVENLSQPGIAYIYSLTGSVYKAEFLSKGRNVIQVPDAAFYVIKVGDKVVKVFVK